MGTKPLLVYVTTRGQQGLKKPGWKVGMALHPLLLLAPLSKSESTPPPNSIKLEKPHRLYKPHLMVMRPERWHPLPGLLSLFVAQKGSDVT